MALDILTSYVLVCSKTVTATASTKEKLDSLLAMPNGATHVANYKTQDFCAEVKKTTDGNGVNVLVDFVGQSHWNKNIDSLALEGRMTILALLSGESLRSISLMLYDYLIIALQALKFPPLILRRSCSKDFVSKAQLSVLEHGITRLISFKGRWTDPSNKALQTSDLLP
jgi:NADPH-dependent curcumin reductase CurA